MEPNILIEEDLDNIKVDMELSEFSEMEKRNTGSLFSDDEYEVN